VVSFPGQMDLPVETKVLLWTNMLVNGMTIFGHLKIIA